MNCITIIQLVQVNLHIIKSALEKLYIHGIVNEIIYRMLLKSSFCEIKIPF